MDTQTRTSLVVELLNSTYDLRKAIAFLEASVLRKEIAIAELLTLGITDAPVANSSESSNITSLFADYALHNQFQPFAFQDLVIELASRLHYTRVKLPQKLRGLMCASIRHGYIRHAAETYYFTDAGKLHFSNLATQAPVNNRPKENNETTANSNGPIRDLNSSTTSHPTIEP